MTLERKTELRADPEKTREWQRRSRRRLPSRSKKREQEMIERRALVVRVLDRQRGRCFVTIASIYGEELLPGIECGSPFPHRRPIEVHEIIMRSSWRGGFLVDDNCVGLCQVHHDYVTVHHREAVAAGLEVRAHLPWDRSTTEGVDDGS